MKWTTTPAILLACAVGVITLSGCGSASTAAPEQEVGGSVADDTQHAEEVSGANTTPGTVEITPAFECAQVGVLQNYDWRLKQGFSNPGGTAEGAAAQQEMLYDLWSTTISGDTSVSPFLRKAEKAALERDSDKLEVAIGAAQDTCTSAGFPTQIRALPGEGG